LSPLGLVPLTDLKMELQKCFPNPLRMLEIKNELIALVKKEKQIRRILAAMHLPTDSPKVAKTRSHVG